MRIYAIRESWDYEIEDLIEFFISLEDATNRAEELNAGKRSSYNEYGVVEVIVK